MKYNLEDLLSVLSESSLDEFYNQYDLYSEGKVEDNIVDTVTKAANTKAGKKIIKSVDELKNKPKNEKVEKAVNTIKTKTKEVANDVANSKVVETIGKAENKALNATSSTIAKVMTKKPGKNSSNEVQKEYQERLDKNTASIKTGLVGGTMAITSAFIGPVDWLGKALTVPALLQIKKSDDPTDKMVVNTIKGLTDKVDNLKDRVVSAIDDVRNENISKEEFTKKYETLGLQGLNYAKEIDAVKSRVESSKTVTESATLSYTFDKYLIKEDGSLVDNAYDILSVIIEKTDYEKYDVCDIIDSYINMML